MRFPQNGPCAASFIPIHYPLIMPRLEIFPPKPSSDHSVISMTASVLFPRKKEAKNERPYLHPANSELDGRVGITLAQPFVSASRGRLVRLNCRLYSKRLVFCGNVESVPDRQRLFRLLTGRHGTLAGLQKCLSSISLLQSHIIFFIFFTFFVPRAPGVYF